MNRPDRQQHRRPGAAEPAAAALGEHYSTRPATSDELRRAQPRALGEHARRTSPVVRRRCRLPSRPPAHGTDRRRLPRRTATGRGVRRRAVAGVRGSPWGPVVVRPVALTVITHLPWSCSGCWPGPSGRWSARAGGLRCARWARSRRRTGVVHGNLTASRTVRRRDQEPGQPAAGGSRGRAAGRRAAARSHGVRRGSALVGNGQSAAAQRLRQRHASAGRGRGSSRRRRRCRRAAPRRSPGRPRRRGPGTTTVCRPIRPQHQVERWPATPAGSSPRRTPAAPDSSTRSPASTTSASGTRTTRSPAGVAAAGVDQLHAPGRRGRRHRRRRRSSRPARPRWPATSAGAGRRVLGVRQPCIRSPALGACARPRPRGRATGTAPARLERSARCRRCGRSARGC